MVTNHPNKPEKKLPRFRSVVQVRGQGFENAV